MALTFSYAEAKRWLKSIPKKMFNTKRLLAVCKVVITNDIREAFKAGKDPDDHPWKPLAFPRPNGKFAPLWDTGRLVASTKGGKGHVERLTPTSLTMGTNLEYAALQQFGGVVRPKKAKWLAIPLTMAAKKAGSPRNFPGKLRAIINKRTRKGVMIGAKVGKVTRGKNKGQSRIGKIEAQYALVKKVKVPPRRFMGFGKRLIGKLQEAIRVQQIKMLT